MLIHNYWELEHDIPLFPFLPFQVVTEINLPLGTCDVPWVLEVHVWLSPKLYPQGEEMQSEVKGLASQV